MPSRATYPTPLTSVATPFDQIAGTALDLLLTEAGHNGTIATALPTLIPRASTARHS